MTKIFNDDSVTTITQSSKQGRITSINDRRTHLDFQNLVDKLEQADITMILEVTESLKMQYVNYVQTTTPQTDNIQDSDNKKQRKLLEYYTYTKRVRHSKAKYHSRNGAIIVADMDISLLNADKNNKTTLEDHRNTENQQSRKTTSR